MSLPSQPIKIPGIKSVIGVLSGKGGVGKTFVAANLGLVLAKLNKKVGLLDADISNPNLLKVLGITNKIVQRGDQKLVPAQRFGVNVISMAGLMASDDEPILWRGPIISKIIQQLLLQSLWGELDILIIDFPTGGGDSIITILHNFSIDGVILVTTPQELAIGDCRRSIRMAENFKIPILGVLENMRGDIFGEGGANRLCDATGLPFLGSIPMRKPIVSLCDQGKPAIFHLEEIEMIFARIARNIFEKVVVE